MPSDLNVLALVKGNERYIYVYDDLSQPPLVDAMRDQAASPHLSLTWFDVLVLTKRTREQAASAPDVSHPAQNRIGAE